MDTESFRVTVVIEIRFQAPIGLQSDDGAIIIPKLWECTRRVACIIDLVQPFITISPPAYEEYDVPENPCTR
jgi:hypothetical protein